MKTTCLFLLPFCFSGALLAQNCNNASLSGAYAYAASGNMTVDGKISNNSEVGRMVFDGKGGITGYAARTVAGTSNVGTFTGSYAVGADCTTTGRTTYSDGALDFDMVVVNAGNDFVFVLRHPAFTESGSGTKIEAQGKCSAASVSGAFGYQGDGNITLDGKLQTLVEVGILTFNGTGSVTGTYSAAAGGELERLTFTGTYELGEDCTGNMKFNIAGGAYVNNFVIASGTNTMLYSEVGPNSVITGSGARTTPK
ncbi:MAG: hypothetical protein SGI92_27750 [Bryobacteraceae bacterium]|nr:hypothetical protein [Bryobacteraceae bacterium]